MKRKYYIFVTVILLTILFRNVISSFIVDKLGIPLFGKVYSSVSNDILIGAVLLLFVLVCIPRIKEWKWNPRLHWIAIGISIIAVYCWHRICYNEIYTPFAFSGYVYYAGVLWGIIIITLLLLLGLSKQKPKDIDNSSLYTPFLKKYFAENSVDYAVMLNDVWGAGKTFYWKNTLTKELKKANFRIIYISLFGIENVDSLKQIIWNKLYPNATHPIWTTIGNKALKILGIEWGTNDTDTVLGTLDVEWKNIVICFDDLERVSEGKLGDLLGHINVFVEHSGSHIFFICNETKIHEKDKNIYAEYKEKLIRYTWKPRIDFNTILENLCNSFPAHFAERLGYVYNRAKCKNIRIVKANIEVMHKMWNVLQDYENEETHAYFIFLSAHYCIVFHEYGEMNLQNVVDLAEKEHYELDFGYNNPFVHSNLDDINNTGDSEENTEILKLKKRFKDCAPRYKLGKSNTLIAYICNGEFNETSFKSEVERIDSYLKKYRISPEKSIIAKLNNFWYAEDQETKEIVDIIIKKVQSGEYASPYYPELYNRLVTLRKWELIDFPYDDIQLKLLFMEGLKKTEIASIDDIETVFSAIMEPTQECIEIYNEVRSRNESKESESFGKIVPLILLNAKRWNELYDYDSTNYSQYKNIPPKTFFDVFTNASNAQKRLWLESIERRKKNANVNSDEIGFLKEIRALSQEYVDNHDFCTSRRYCKAIVKHIDDILYGLEKGRNTLE